MTIDHASAADQASVADHADAAAPLLTEPGRTYEVRTFGCQMNVHDSERLSGMLDAAGYRPVPKGDPADLVVFNTCAVRENADNKLYGNLARGCRSRSAAAWRRRTGK
jgi:tRNA-2-methylthio-N6-dimethylallyladenosine synthase